jgi:MFS family permease
MTWNVLAHRGMRWYLAGNVCSNVGTWLQNTAQIVLAYQLTDSVVGVGLVIGSQFAGPLLCGPWAGVIADRLDRRHVLIATHVASAVTAALMAGLESSGRLTLVPLTAGAFAIGVAFTFTLPALTAFVPTLVSEAETRDALALNNASFNVGRALAPVLGVGVITTVGFAWAFALNAVSFVVLAAILTGLRPRAVVREAGRPRLLDGLRIARRERRIMVVLVMVVLATVATDPPLVLGPMFAHHVFDVPALWSAYFLAAFGTGTIVGSFLPDMRPSLRRAAIHLGLLGVALTGFAFSPGFWWGIGAVALAGVASLLVGAATQTLLLSLSGSQRAGRVMAVWAVAFAGSRSIATAVDTWLVGAVGPRMSAFLLALPALVVAGVVLALQASDRGRQWARGVLAGARPIPLRALPWQGK